MSLTRNRRTSPDLPSTCRFRSIRNCMIYVAEDLVDKTASEASQNMKVDASDHAVALDQAIGKTRLFTIGMNPEYFSKFSINYVLKKSYPVDGQNLNTASAPQDPADKNALALPSPTNTNLSHSPVITTPHAESSSTVTHQILDESSNCPDVDNPISSKTKRQLLFHKDAAVNNQSSTLSDNNDDNVDKRQKTKP